MATCILICWYLSTYSDTM